MIPGLRRDISEEEIRQYRDDGVVRLRGLLTDAWIEKLGPAIDKAIYDTEDSGLAYYNATELADALRAVDGAVLTDPRAEAIEQPGQYRTAIGTWTVVPEMREFALESPLGYVAARLFGANEVCFYDDQTLVKEPGTREYTAFHTDEPYYHLTGEQVCGIWVSPDAVSEDSGAMQYVRGSHLWGTFFKPNQFIGQGALSALGSGEDDATQVQLPDIEGNRKDYDIVTHPSEPGDVIVHHSRLIHGSGPNYTPDRRRRAVSLRYTGDDVRFHLQKSAPPQPHHHHDLQEGDRLACAQFPRVWPR